MIQLSLKSVTHLNKYIEIQSKQGPRDYVWARNHDFAWSTCPPALYYRLRDLQNLFTSNCYLLPPPVHFFPNSFSVESFGRLAISRSFIFSIIIRAFFSCSCISFYFSFSLSNTLNRNMFAMNFKISAFSNLKPESLKRLFALQIRCLFWKF